MSKKQQSTDPSQRSTAPALNKENAPEASAVPAAKSFTGFWHSSTWTYAVMLVGAALGLLSAFTLSAETLKLARNGNAPLSCDVNTVVSCSSVAQSPQAELITIGSLSFPNAFFGIAAYSVFITVAVIGLAQVKLPRWFAGAAWGGGLLALLFSYWLFSQSLFVIKALCPWCMLMMGATTVMFMALSHATVTVQGLGANAGWLRTYYRLHYDWMVDVLWIAAIVALVVITEGPALFA